VRCLTALVPAGCLLAAGIARAAEPGPRVDFRADRVVIDQGSAELEGDVHATCGPYALDASKLRIATAPGSVEVTGPATVTLCPCPTAPVSIRFARATIRPPSDLVLRRPALRIGDTTVLWLPAAWLRTPDQPGLLTPRLAWRGDDGLLIGPGFHLPWVDATSAPASLDVYVSGYTSGGLELDTALRTRRAETRLRFDHAGDASLLDLRATGSTGPAPVSASWFADLARGSRAPAGLIEFDRALRTWDHARAEAVARPWRSLSVATSIEAWGSRRTQRPMAFGPVASLSGEGALGSIGSWQLAASSRWLAAPDTAADRISRAVGSAHLMTFAGPMRVRARGRGAATALDLDGARGQDLFASGDVDAAFPLVRGFGRDALSWTHRVEPFVTAGAIAASTSGESFRVAGRPAAIAEGTRWIASTGVRTDLVARGGTAAARAELSAGQLGGRDGEAGARVATGSVATEGSKLSVRAEAAAVDDHGQRGSLLIGRARLGKAQGAHVAVRGAHRDAVDAVTARALVVTDPFALGSSWLDASGTSVGADAVVPLFRGYRAQAGGDADAQSSRVLAWRVGLLYAHPCGCLAATSWVSHRIGRAGVDAWLSLDLIAR